MDPMPLAEAVTVPSWPPPMNVVPAPVDDTVAVLKLPTAASVPALKHGA